MGCGVGNTAAALWPKWVDAIYLHSSVYGYKTSFFVPQLTCDSFVLSYGWDNGHAKSIHVKGGW